MKIETHEIDGIRIAEVVAEEAVISNPEDALQLFVDIYYQDFDRIIIHEKDIVSDFFDLKTGIAGEILQKVSNYRLRLAIVGEFDKYPGKSIRDFIFESNKGRQVNFLSSVEEALARLGK